MANSFYAKEELKKIGFRSYGDDVLISRKASIYGAKDIVMGNHVRIDDFCILSGRIELGSYIHISAYTGLFGGTEGIALKDFVTVSSRCAIYAESDDYLGNCLTNPMIPEEYRKTYKSKVSLEKHVLVGSSCTILPGVHLNEGASVGAMSLINRDLEAWTINYGNPCMRMKERKRIPLEQEAKMREEGLI